MHMALGADWAGAQRGAGQGFASIPVVDARRLVDRHRRGHVEEVLLLGAATFNLFYSFVSGLLMFAGLYGFALWATTRDLQMLRILLPSSQARRRYDPGKHTRVDVERASC
jgi:hypothetical protein